MRSAQSISSAQALGLGLLIFLCAGASQAEALLGVDRLVDQALSEHPSIRGRQAEKESAEHGVSAAKWRFGPSVTSSKDSANESASAGQLTGTVAVEQPLWTGGALTSELERVEAVRRRVGWSYEETRESIASQVISAYGDWLRARGQVLAARRTKDAYEALLATIVRRERAGVAAKVEVELVRSRMAALGADLATLESLEATALQQLSQLTGSEVQSAGLAFESYQGRERGLEEILDGARSRSPALKRVRGEAEIASAEVNAKRAVLWPQLSLVWQRNYYDVSGLPGASSQVDQALIRLKFQPGAGLSTASEVDAASARFKAALSDADAAQRDLNIRVSAVYRKYSSLLLSRRSSVVNWLAARNIVASYQRQFISGKRSWLEVMNAARELDQIERALADLDGNLFVAERLTHLMAYGLDTAEAQ